MKCAAVATMIVFIAFASQVFAVFRPLLPAKAGPPFSGGAIIIGDGWVRYSTNQAPATVPR